MFIFWIGLFIVFERGVFYFKQNFIVSCPKSSEGQHTNNVCICMYVCMYACMYTNINGFGIGEDIDKSRMN